MIKLLIILIFLTPFVNAHHIWNDGDKREWLKKLVKRKTMVLENEKSKYINPNKSFAIDYLNRLKKINVGEFSYFEILNLKKNNPEIEDIGRLYNRAYNKRTGKIAPENERDAARGVILFNEYQNNPEYQIMHVNDETFDTTVLAIIRSNQKLARNSYEMIIHSSKLNRETDFSYKEQNHLRYLYLIEFFYNQVDDAINDMVINNGGTLKSREIFEISHLVNLQAEILENPEKVKKKLIDEEYFWNKDNEDIEKKIKKILKFSPSDIFYELSNKNLSEFNQLFYERFSIDLNFLFSPNEY